ncbi:MAG: GNAT family N-acetyltransferase [Ferruginibacter sp.]|nr:GNAT family N-acetyltransferase [Ferruginibacter sp.]
MENFSFLPFQNVESDRLLLRQIIAADVNEIFALRSNADIMKYIPRPLCNTKDEALAYIKILQDNLEKNEACNWAITLKGNTKLIGIIGHYRIRWEHYRSEIGYMLLPEYYAKGIATEAVKMMVDFGFNQMNMHSLEGIIAPENIASARVLEKNNFVKEAHLIENEFFDGRFLDTVIYSLRKQ